LVLKIATPSRYLRKYSFGRLFRKFDMVLTEVVSQSGAVVIVTERFAHMIELTDPNPELAGCHRFEDPQSVPKVFCLVT
jgi:hypothetical protein